MGKQNKATSVSRLAAGGPNSDPRPPPLPSRTVHTRTVLVHTNSTHDDDAEKHVSRCRQTFLRFRNRRRHLRHQAPLTSKPPRASRTMPLACLTHASGAAPSTRAVAPSRRDVVAGATSTTARARPFAHRGDASCSVSAVSSLSPSPASRALARRGASPTTAARASSSSSAAPASPFQQLESLLGAASAAANTGSRDLGWREVEGAWVLAPPAGAKPRARPPS